METKKVAAAIIRSGKEILLTRRKPGEKLAGYWEFPGGKIEENETIQQCLEREIHEELNIYINAGKVITSSIHTYRHGKIELIALEAEVTSGNLQLTVHDKADWVHRPGESIKKILEVDPLKCPHCASEMKIISSIKEEKVIRKILEHLKLWDETARGRPPKDRSGFASAPTQHEEKLTQQEPFDDGWPGYEESFSLCD